MMFRKLMVPAVISFILVGSLLDSHSQTTVYGGYVSGNWDVSGSPYIIQDDILVHPDSTLQIGPGTSVLFTGLYMLEVQGQLLAMGTETDSVLFDRETDTTAWRGIYLNTTDTSITDSSIIQYSTIRNCSNSCVKISSSSRLRLDRCTISHGNDFRGGGINCISSSPLFIGLWVTGNTTLDGAGISLDASDATLLNCSIWENLANGAGGGMAIFNGSSPYIDGCYIQNTSVGSGGGVYINAAFPVFKRCTFHANLGALGGGILYSGGAVSVKLNAEAYFENCIFSANECFRSGGAIAAYSPVEMLNCLFDLNSAYVIGGSIFLGAANPLSSDITNCTFNGNTAPQGATFAAYNHAGIFRNCIIGSYASDSASVFRLESITATVMLDIDYSDVRFEEAGIQREDNALYIYGQHNFDQDPMWESNSYELSWSSPCIEAGTPDTTGLGLPEFDLGGNPRIVNTRVDIGAYEYQLPVEIPNSKFQIPGVVNVYPVPARDHFFVKMDENSQKGTMQLCNLQGEVLLQVELTSPLTEVNTKSYPPGIYLVKIFNEDGFCFRKIILY